MEPEKVTSVEAMMSALSEKKKEGLLPGCVRYCEGTDPEKDNAFFNKRLFIGDEAIWVDTHVDTAAIRKSIEDAGYESYADQRVPDGFGRNYDSTYYCHRDSDEAQYYLKKSKAA